MKRCNGSGCIRRLNGRRRKPYQVIVTISNNNVRVQKHLGTFRTKREAQSYLDDYNKSNVKQKMNFESICKEWENYKFKSISENTQKSYHSTLKQFEELNNMNIDDIRLNDLQEQVNKLASSMQKVAKNILIKLFDYALINDYVSKNYAEFIVTKNHVEAIRERIISNDEISKIVSSKSLMAEILQVLLYSGMRIGELLNLKIENVNIEEQYFSIIKSKTHNGIRSIPIHQKIFDVVKKNMGRNNEYLFEISGKKIDYNNFYAKYKRILKNHAVHDTRHTFITRCSECGIDMVAIKKIAGHESKDVTISTYTHISLIEMKKELEKLYYNV